MNSFYKYCDALVTFPDPKHGPRVDTVVVGDERLTRQECMERWTKRCRVGSQCDAPTQEGAGSDKSSSAARSEPDELVSVVDTNTTD